MRIVGFCRRISFLWFGFGRVKQRFAGFEVVKKKKKKLQFLKGRLKDWNCDVFGKIEINQNAVLEQIERWDLIEEERVFEYRGESKEGGF